MSIKVTLNNKGSIINILINEANKISIINNFSDKFKNFQINTSSHHWNTIIEKFSKIESSFLESFKNKKSYVWNIDLTNYPFIVGNYLNVLPYYIKVIM